MRAVSKYLLAVLAVLVLIPGMGLMGSALLIGNEDAVVGTVEVVLSNDNARTVMGNAFVDELLKKASLQDVAALKASRAQLGAAAADGIAEQSTNISDAVRRGYNAVMDGTPTTISLAPELIAIMHKLHAVDPAVPDDKEFLEAHVTIGANDVDGPQVIATVVGASWFVILIGVLMLVTVAFLSVFRGWRRWRLPGICLAIAGAWWTLFALSLPGTMGSAITDANPSAIAQSVGSVIAREFLLVGLGALMLGAVLIVLSIVFRSRPAPMAIATSSTPAL
ncbi:MAG: hypothetical protein WC005_03015 [Candidatus Nanopelagicales bacterium]